MCWLFVWTHTALLKTLVAMKLNKSTIKLTQKGQLQGLTSDFKELRLQYFVPQVSTFALIKSTHPQFLPTF